MADESSSRSRRSFGPVVLLGLAAAVLTAVASARQWMSVVEGTGGVGFTPPGTDGAQVPLASALSLVLLAGWGVLLVTRGRVRRAMALLGVLASIGVLACVVYAWSAVPASLTADAERVGVAPPDVAVEPWYWAAAIGALLSLLATGAALRFVPGWPEMGSRYDAPAGETSTASEGPAARGTTGDVEENLDLWKSLDEGHDPTA